MNAIKVLYEYEDELPEMDDETYEEIFEHSKIDGVRVFAYVMIKGIKHYLI